MSERPHYDQQDAFEEIRVSFEDAEKEQDIEVRFILDLWVDYLCTLPKNMQILQDVQTAQK